MAKIDANQARRRDAPGRALPRGGRGATSRLGPAAQLPHVIRELGFAPSAVLAGTGFDEEYFEDPDMPIPYATGSRLLAHCATATGCEHLALLIGLRAGPGSLGLAGLLLMSADSVGSALQDLVKHFELHDRGGMPTLEMRGDLCLFGFTVVEPAVDTPEQLYDLAMVMACNIMRGLCGPTWNPTEVLLSRRPPADATPWKTFFRAPVQFGATRCALVFPTIWLAHRVTDANPLLHHHLEKQAAELRDQQPASGFAGEIRRLIRGTITHERCSAARVSQLLGMNTRTLNRRLLAEGTTFKAVRDDVFHDVARQLLRTTSLNLTEVAHLLGYAEASSFVHAFSRWSGHTPQQWRRGITRPNDDGLDQAATPIACDRSAKTRN
jgi:AraC-like DNA-binding protein